MKNCFLCILKVAVDFGTGPHPDPASEVRIRIRAKMSRIRNIVTKCN
jgi:hypothetical protein